LHLARTESPPISGSGDAVVDVTAQPMRNYDGTEMRDVQSNVVYKSQFLATHPLKTDCKERVGYAGKRFTYVSGDGVIRTMNAIFGHGGWSSQMLMERNILSEKDERGRWNVGYLASVRVTLLANGACHEDCGSGEGIDPNKVKAHEKAMKSAVTDAMKRAARHFGERLGNALYVKGSGMRSAPRTNRDALAELERKDALNLFGDQAVLRANHDHNVQCKSSPRNEKASPSSSATKDASATAAANSVNALQKENWPPQNRAVGPNATVTTAAASSYHSRPSPNNGQQPASSTTGSTVLPSPIASSSTAPCRGTSQTVVRTGNPSPASDNSNTYQPPNNANRNSLMNAPQPPNLMAPPPGPSPASSSNNNVHRHPNINSNNNNRNPLVNAPQPPNLMVPPPGTSSASNNNNIYQPPNNDKHNSLMNAPQPPNLMAPPPRPSPASKNNNTYHPSNNVNRNSLVNAPRPPNLMARHSGLSPAFNNNNAYRPPNNSTGNSLMKGPQPASLMAPPPGPAPASINISAYPLTNNGNNRNPTMNASRPTNSMAGKRSSDGTNTHNGNRRHSTNVLPSYADANSGGDGSKRQKVNPYNSVSGNKRMSV